MLAIVAEKSRKIIQSDYIYAIDPFYQEKADMLKPRSTEDYYDSWNFGIGVYTTIKNFDLLDNDYIQVIGTQLEDYGDGYKY